MCIRDSANLGACTQPCRWQYALVEQKRPGQYYPILQDERGSYILSAYDLCMIGHLKELEAAGISSVKIEGRMKTAYYVANVMNAYRRALDGKNDAKDLRAELDKSSHRPYNTGFFFGRPQAAYDAGDYLQDYDFVAVVREYDEKAQMAVVEQRNAFFKGDRLEILSPKECFNRVITVEEMQDSEGRLMEKAILPQQVVKLFCPVRVSPMDILRRKK